MTIELSDEKLKSDNGMMKRLLAHFIAKEGGEVKIPMRSIHSVSECESVEVCTDVINRFVRLRCGHRIPANPEPEHEEFLMAADLLEEHGMDRAAKALREYVKITSQAMLAILGHPRQPTSFGLFAEREMAAQAKELIERVQNEHGT